MHIKTKMQLIVANIRSRRVAKGYSQQYFASRLNISQNAYSKIEIGRTPITLMRLLQIAEVLEVDLSDLINVNAAA
jgi:transcriptional regulator with XRE-family HTH domain